MTNFDIRSLFQIQILSFQREREKEREGEVWKSHQTLEPPGNDTQLLVL